MTVRLLLTSAAVTNPSIGAALVRLLGRPVADATAVVVPTAAHALPDGPALAGHQLRVLADMGWKELRVLELAAMADVPREHWLPGLRSADAIVVGGGNGAYLSHWMHRSGLAQLLPELLADTVYVGISAGSMIVTAGLNVDRARLAATGEHHDDEYDETGPPGASDDRTVPLVDFVVRPHLGSPVFPMATEAFMERAAARVDVPLYAIDDDTAVVVDGGEVTVVSEGTWRLFPA